MILVWFLIKVVRVVVLKFQQDNTKFYQVPLRGVFLISSNHRYYPKCIRNNLLGSTMVEN